MTNTQEDTQEFLITLLDFLNEQIYLYNKELNKNFQITMTTIFTFCTLNSRSELT